MLNNHKMASTRLPENDGKQNIAAAGKPVSRDYPSQSYKKNLRKTSACVAVLFILFIILQYVLPLSLAYIFMVLGLPVTLDFDSLSAITTMELTLILSMLSTALSVAFTGGFLNYLLGKPFSARAWSQKPKPGYLAVGTVVLVAVGVLSSVWLHTVQGVASYFHIVLAPSIVVFPQEPAEMILYLIKVTIIPALFEELLFRGILLGGLRKFGEGFAIFFSSLVFALCHANVLQMLNAFIMGLVLGYFVAKGKSIWIGIVMHFVSNLVSALQTIALQGLPGEKTEIVLHLFNMIFLVIGVAALVFFVVQYKSAFTVHEDKKQLPFGKRCRIFVSTLPMLILLVMLAVRISHSISFSDVI